jgi:hypothetical protein
MPLQILPFFLRKSIQFDASFMYDKSIYVDTDQPTTFNVSNFTEIDSVFFMASCTDIVYKTNKISTIFISCADNNDKK